MAKSDKVGIVDGGGNYKDKTLKQSLSKKSNRAMSYQILDIRQVFPQLRQMFTKTSILQYFDLKYYIQI